MSVPVSKQSAFEEDISSSKPFMFMYIYIYMYTCSYIHVQNQSAFCWFKNPRLPLLSDGRKSLQVTNLNSPRNHVDVSESKALDPPEDPQRIEETSVNQSDSVSKIRKKVVILMCFFFKDVCWTTFSDGCPTRESTVKVKYSAWGCWLVLVY